MRCGERCSGGSPWQAVRGVGRRPWQLVAVAGGTRGSASGGVVLIASAMRWLTVAVLAV